MGKGSTVASIFYCDAAVCQRAVCHEKGLDLGQGITPGDNDLYAPATC
jgi:hypothetical protein